MLDRKFFIRPTVIFDDQNVIFQSMNCNR